jgi:flavin reductase (DIM6/NTAB) family NADH-FMN oxidoreductase RutF
MSSNAGMEPASTVDSQPFLDSRLFRRVCAQFATGITVVTVTDPEGQPHGLTVNSFSSVSLNPPLILVSIDLRSSVLPHFLSNPSFAVNVLSADQEALSRVFSTPGLRRFEGVSWRCGELCVPLLDDCLAHMECSTVRSVDAGDHTLFIGEVRRAVHREGKPLIYFNSCYQNLG